MRQFRANQVRPLARSLVSRLNKLRRGPETSQWRTVLAVVAPGALLAAMIWAWDRSGLTADDLRWKPVLALMVITSPLSFLLKAAEFSVAAQIAGHRPSRRLAAETAVLSSVANLAPLPGSLLVTVQTLAERGSSYGRALTASAIPGIAWLGITAGIGGVAIASRGSLGLGVLASITGVVVLGAAAAAFVRTVPASRRVSLAAATLTVELGWLAISATRFTLAAAAVGVSLTPAQALSFSVAGALTVAIGFVPGGLGVREALIAGLSPLVGLPVDVGVLMGAIDRVVWLGALAIAGTVMLAARRYRTAETNSANGSE